MTRQEAIEFGTDRADLFSGKMEEFIKLSVKALKEQRPKGHWERHYSRPNVLADLFWHCSECSYKSDNYYANHFNFCPYCGANMCEVES